MDNRSAELLPELTTRRERARRLGRVFSVVICIVAVFSIFHSEILDYFELPNDTTGPIAVGTIILYVALAAFYRRVWSCPACEHRFRSLDIVRCDNCGLQVRQDGASAVDDELKPRGRLWRLTKSDPAFGSIVLGYIPGMLVYDCVHDAVESTLQVRDWLHNVLALIPAVFVAVLVTGLSELALDWYCKR